MGEDKDTKTLTYEAVEQIAAYLGIQEGEYDMLAVMNSREDDRLYIFPILEAQGEIERRSIVPKDGNVYLLNSKKAWADLREKTKDVWRDINNGPW